MLEFLNAVLSFIDHDLYEMLVQFLSLMIQSFVAMLYEWFYQIIHLAWDVARDILSDLGISQLIGSMFSHFDSQVLDLMLYFRVPEMINTVITAYVTRYVMSWIPFSGIS